MTLKKFNNIVHKKFLYSEYTVIKKMDILLEAASTINTQNKIKQNSAD